MDKIKFKNPKKYKGIVEKVFVKEGQPVKKDEVIALISTQLEKFEIKSTIDGVIRNIYVIESLIVSHGDTVFDVFSDKEINSLLKKPTNINDTLKEGLNEFGYLEKLINEPETEEETAIEVSDSLTEELSSLQNLNNDEYEEIGVTKSFNQINEDFKMDEIEEKQEKEVEDRKYVEVSDSLTEELASLDYLNINNENEIGEISSVDEIVEDFVEEKEETDEFQPPVFVKSETNIVQLDIKPITVADSITEELALNHALVFEDEKDIEIFSNHDPKVSETQVLEKLSNHKFLSKFTAESEGKELESEVLETENKEQENLKIKENQEVINEFKAEINKEKQELEIKVEADKEGFNHEGPKFDYLNDFDDEKLEKILKNSEELENKFNSIEHQKEELEDKIKDIDSRISEFNSKLKEEIEHSTKEVDLDQFEDKFKEVNEKVNKFISNSKEENSKTISDLLSKVEDKIKNLDEKLKQVSSINTNNSKSETKITEKKVVVDKTNIGNFSFKIDITALISLQTLMIEPLKENGSDLELNSFYVKALKKTLSKFEELDSKDSLIRLIKTNGIEANDTVLKVENDSSILNISKEIEKNTKYNNQELKVSLYDLTSFGIDNASFGLSNDSVISIYIASISNSFKEDGTLSNFAKINFAFNQNVLEPQDAIMFGKEFISILKNPGFLI
ncbi:biotin/lipoyl-containing protein [Spiroplasma sp. BIUS-1]|uniref:biotin/lipoyl-containing protein n=1 Tax=Spiroplasma sp. BIUS-1 TaxID=216964 RepID=UPI0013978FEC|nr:biotin/lipoyl-containing protein [Spiroplasma sp. BIUS-1]QHX36892.1 biotin/lipoyl-binding protein [Spiroplasma sp. BIUS-1]